LTEGVVVLDVGKTLSKLTCWTASGDLLARRTRANQRISEAAYTALDHVGIAAWLTGTLAEFAELAKIGRIITVGHGAAAVLIRDDAVICPPMDYEHPIPAGSRQRYDECRDRFSLTGSPALADGLNLGAQLHFLEELRPDLRDTTILLWPQYWAWFLSGVSATELTSLGCHTDLWRPLAGEPSLLARTRSWAARLPPIRKPEDVLGPIRPELSKLTGLPPATLIHCGLHDSNAALVAARGYPELAQDEATVLSTGTWFIAMRSTAPGADIDLFGLPEGRDCLVNVDAGGAAVPSARFMGGREIETLAGIDTRPIDVALDQDDVLAALPAVLAKGSAPSPNFAAGFGPYPRARGRWVDRPADETERRAAIGLYVALLADVSLDLIGATGPVLVEGRFASVAPLVRTLATLRAEAPVYIGDAANDVAYGALRLLYPTLRPKSKLTRAEPLALDLDAHRRQWRAEAERLELAA
jgi:sugar (pentulose or hexulose) kinase